MKRTLIPALFFTIFVLIFNTEAQAPKFDTPQIPFSPNTYMVHKTPSPLTIDGKMNERIWLETPWSANFVDIEGPSKPLPTLSTRIKMLWDDQYWYFFALLKEPHVWAKLTQRDTVIFYDNDFEIFIDPDGDTHHYYEFEVNAFGTEWDLFIDKPYRDDATVLDEWNMNGMKTAIFVDGTINNPIDVDRAWQVEVAIPWKVLEEAAHRDTPPMAGDQWRVNFSRVQWQTDIINGKYIKRINPATGKHFPENNWVWSPQGLINMHYPEMWGFAQFSDEAPGNTQPQISIPDFEFAKWELRRIYYLQRQYKMDHGQFANSLKTLGYQMLSSKGFMTAPDLHATPNLFEATVWLNDSRTQGWRITQDGRVSAVGTTP